MLSGPAILRISVLLLIAGALAALVQFLLPPAPAVPVAQPPASERPADAAPAEPEADTPLEPTRPPPELRVAPAAPSSVPAPAQMPTEALAFPSDAISAPRGEAEVARAEETAGPRAVALVDLNTASVAELNRMQGGGSIGRAIVAKRPYASVDQLLSKRVLSRAVYDRIREQVTVR